jgi:hypothetical protein
MVGAAFDHGAAAVDRLDEAIAQTNARGGQVYFLTILDMAEEDWAPFLGDRLGLPYDALDTYRRDSRVVKTFDANGTPVTLRRYEPSRRSIEGS